MEGPHKEYGEKVNFDEWNASSITGNQSIGNPEMDAEDNGSQYLVNKYNINDQAYSDSSLEDFVKTTSGFRHADDVSPDTNVNENPGGISNVD